MTSLNPDPILAAEPAHSAVVKASAGVGKTYLLVTRLIRLLFDDVPPDSILAITFTRKAAAEMQSRLFARLFQYALLPEPELLKALPQIGITPSAENIDKARNLYETLLLSTHQVKTSTFHAFCQEVLSKFPLEADVPPGFDLLEDISAIKDAAWQALYDEATALPDASRAKSLETLYSMLGGLANTHDALESFLDQRQDWWAFTRNQKDPLAFATLQLKDLLHYTPDVNPYETLYSHETTHLLKELRELLAKHAITSNLSLLDNLERILAIIPCCSDSDDSKAEQLFEVAWNFTFTGKDEIRIRSTSKTREKKLGVEGEQKLLSGFSRLAEILLQARELRNRQYNFILSRAWLDAGDALLKHFQRIKLEQRMLDFADLEWKTFCLLQSDETALWAQYKLDQRIDHLLVDEFQDTNPTQWRLLLPLLEEFAAQQDRSRSVFIVGDKKQSIYSFRRADPALLEIASDWLQNNLQAQVFPMDKSRRSSLPVMNLVNAVFQGNGLLSEFHEHSTFLQTLPGSITLLPLAIKDEETPSVTPFRNPLTEPRLASPSAGYEEGKQIAAQIQSLIASTTHIITDSGKRQIRYEDIMLLVRSRKNVANYERAFREANIPFVSNNRGTLFECQEIQDLLHLLNVLYTPFNDIALASVLRSPLFACCNESLLYLSKNINKTQSWFDGLLEVSQSPNAPDDLRIASTTLSRWQQFVGKLPMHDLLDFIFHDAGIFEKYQQQIPPEYHQRVVSNLNQFLSLSLEIDSGRYPSLGRFISRLQNLRQQDNAPDEAISGHQSSNVRILTIHAAKGLEAPVVFLADTASTLASNNSYQAIAQWPEHADRPQVFFLTPKKEFLCNPLLKLIEVQVAKQMIEDANLLYVALTRARQQLFISANAKKATGNLGWYGLLQSSWPETTTEWNPENNAPEQSNVEEKSASMDSDLSPLFTAPVSDNHDTLEMPQTPEETTRGQVIHRAIQLLCEHTDNRQDNILLELTQEFNALRSTEEITEDWREALNVYQYIDFAKFFSAEHFKNAYNEFPIYGDSAFSRQKLSFIDRLILTDQLVYIIDYKTHIENNAVARQAIAASYKEQLANYKNSVTSLFPDKEIKCFILFTHHLELVPINI